MSKTGAKKDAPEEVPEEADVEAAEGATREGPENDKPMTFWEHLEELRTRIIRSAALFLVACGFAWWQKGRILQAIAKPFCDAWIKENVEGKCALNFASPQAPFMSYAKLAAIGGAAVSAPFVFYQLWGFIAPGLYAREKKYIYPFAGASTLLFVGGGWFGYLAAFPFTFGYFLSLAGNRDTGEHLTIVPVVTMENYIDFVTQMLFGFGLIFEIPIVLSFLALVGIVNHKMLIKFARYYVLVAFIASAILTPPDWTSQLVMAIPACLLYGISIGLVYIMQKKAPQ